MDGKSMKRSILLFINVFKFISEDKARLLLSAALANDGIFYAEIIHCQIRNAISFLFLCFHSICMAESGIHKIQ